MMDGSRGLLGQLAQLQQYAPNAVKNCLKTWQKTAADPFMLTSGLCMAHTGAPTPAHTHDQKDSERNEVILCVCHLQLYTCQFSRVFFPLFSTILFSSYRKSILEATSFIPFCCGSTMFSCSTSEKGRTVISNMRVHVSEQQLGGGAGREGRHRRKRTVGYSYMYEQKHNFPSSDS